MAKLNDPEIRSALLDRMRSPNRWIRSEVGMEKRILDVLLVEEQGTGDGVFHGFEIKSEVDSLKRLSDQTHRTRFGVKVKPGQASAFSRVCDRMTLVCHTSHVPEVISDRLIPQWWGILSAHRSQTGSVVFTEVRPCMDNPSLGWNDVAKLLWGSEIRSLYNRYFPNTAPPSTKGMIRSVLRRVVPMSELRSFVREKFRTRVWDSELPAKVKRRVKRKRTRR